MKKICKFQKVEELLTSVSAESIHILRKSMIEESI